MMVFANDVAVHNGHGGFCSCTDVSEVHIFTDAAEPPDTEIVED